MHYLGMTAGDRRQLHARLSDRLIGRENEVPVPVSRTHLATVRHGSGLDSVDVSITETR